MSDSEGEVEYEEEGPGELDEDYYEDPMPVARGKQFEILSPEMLVLKQQGEIAKIMEVMEVSEEDATILLRQFHWNGEALMNRCFESGRNLVFRAAGLEPALRASSSLGHLECECCFDVVTAGESVTLSCGHCFCNVCWQSYVRLKVKEGEARHLHCMQQGCRVGLSTAMVSRLLTPEELQRYERQLLDAYVDDSPKIKWCPSAPHCGNAIFAGLASPAFLVQVECLCGQEFCFNCLQPPHGPATCSMVKAWLSKLQMDGDNSTWLSKNTKDCPVCGQPVEKNGGCNLMACRCGVYFCWICGMRTGVDHTWTEIKGHTCGKYKENFDADSAKTQLQRFQHYHDRFKANTDSAKLELRLAASLDARIEELQRVGDGSISTWDWLATGIQTLRQCRQVLRWTYTWAYFAFASPDSGSPYSLRLENEPRLSAKNIFEDSQEQLEFLTERLSEELENPVNVTSDEQLTVLRTTVMSMTRAAENRCKGIFDVLEKTVPKDDFVEFR